MNSPKCLLCFIVGQYFSHLVLCVLTMRALSPSTSCVTLSTDRICLLMASCSPIYLNTRSLTGSPYNIPKTKPYLVYSVESNAQLSICFLKLKKCNFLYPKSKHFFLIRNEYKILKKFHQNQIKM